MSTRKKYFFFSDLRQQLLGQLRAADFVRAGKKAPKGKSNGEFGSIKDCNLNSDKWSVVKGTCDLNFIIKNFKILFLSKLEIKIFYKIFETFRLKVKEYKKIALKRH